MKLLSSVFLVGFLAYALLAQTGATIDGRLFEDGKPTPNIQVKLVFDGLASGQTYETTTDENGNYRFEKVVDGAYSVFYVDRRGVVVITRRVLVASGRIVPQGDGKTAHLLGEVSVIATGVSQTDGVISKTIDIIDNDEITKRNEISLVDTLRTIPGFRVQQLGGFGKTASIKTRGLRNQDTSVLIDGIRFRDPAAITGDASPFLSDFTTANIGRVEILRGSGSSIYGTNAIGGVVDFRTPEPQSELNGSALAEYGGLGMTRFRGSIGTGTEDGKIAFTTGFSKTRFTEGIDGEDDADNFNYQGRVDYSPTDATRISGRIYFSDAFVRLNTNPDTLGILPFGQIIKANHGLNFLDDQNDPDNFQRSDFFIGQLSFTQTINSKASFSASYQGLRTNRENENGGFSPGFQPFGGAQFSTFDGQIHSLNTRLDWTPVSNNRTTFGYEYELEKFGNAGSGPGASNDFFARVNQSSNTFFAQNLLGLLDDRLQLAGGFRAQWFSLETPRFSIANAPYENLTLDNPPTSYTFDGSVSYFLDRTSTKIRGHVGNGYRVPSLYERLGTFFSSFSQSFIALGDPNLEPERSIAFDAGIDQDFFENRVKLSATYFYTRLTDTIGYGNVVPDIGTTTRPFGGYLNEPGGLARGAEFSARMRIANTTSLFGSYTYTNSDQRKPQVFGSGINQTLGIPNHQFSFVATQRFSEKFSLTFDYLGTSSYLAPIFSNSTFSTFIYEFDGNNRADISARYDLFRSGEKFHFEIFSTLENLFDDEYFENGFRTQGISGRAGIGIRF